MTITLILTLNNPAWRLTYEKSNFHFTINYHHQSSFYWRLHFSSFELIYSCCINAPVVFMVVPLRQYFYSIHSMALKAQDHCEFSAQFVCFPVTRLTNFECGWLLRVDSFRANLRYCDMLTIRLISPPNWAEQPFQWSAITFSSFSSYRWYSQPSLLDRRL